MFACTNRLQTLLN